jgi:hypothetical protein
VRSEKLLGQPAAGWVLQATGLLWARQLLAHVGGSVVHPIFRGISCRRVREVFRNNHPIVVKDRINPDSPDDTVFCGAMVLIIV